MEHTRFGFGLVLLLLSLMEMPAYGNTPSGRYAWGKAELRAPDLKVGSTLELSIELGSPGGPPRPIKLFYSLPLEAQILKSDLPIYSDPTAHSQVVTWTGLQEGTKRWTIQFSLPKPGYYRLFGEFEIDTSSPALIRPLEIQVARSIPTIRTEKELEDYIRDGMPLRILQDGTFFDPENIFIEATSHSGRIETWDFGTRGKRIRHWLDGKLGRYNPL